MLSFEFFFLNEFQKSSVFGADVEKVPQKITGSAAINKNKKELTSLLAVSSVAFLLGQ